MVPLKEATKDKHKQAEKMPFSIRMFHGNLSSREYLHYLFQQVEIFKEIECNELPHPSLNRVPNILDDIDELVDTDLISDLTTLNSTNQYTDYLRDLEYDNLLPHIYLNYLALIFGGQMMKQVTPGKGRMYHFDDIEDSIISIRKLQKDEWADEVNRGFDFIINILDELERIHNPKK